MQTEPGQNCESVGFYPDLSEGDVDRLIEEGFAVRRFWLTSGFDRNLKVRNVLDLRRSGSNSHVALADRVVLPRMKDLVDDSVDLAKHLLHDECINDMIADFENALHTLSGERVSGCA